MNLWLDDVYAYLLAKGVAGGATGWTLTEGFLTDDQDQVIAIFSGGGGMAETLREEILQVTMQLRVRAGKLQYPVAAAKWKECYDALHNARQDSLAGYLPGFNYILSRNSDPMHFNDENGRANTTSGWEIGLVTR